MTDTPKKTLTLTRKPSQDSTVSTGIVTRTGKRIIRREELPQVQRLGQGRPKPPANKTKPKKPTRKLQPKKQVTPPTDIKARELNDRLNGFTVWIHFQPLALGIEKDLFRLVNEEHFPGASKKVVQKVLRMHTHHGRYLQAIMQGGARFTFDGTEDGDITDYQRQYAGEVLAKRQSLKQN